MAVRLVAVRKDPPEHPFFALAVWIRARRPVGQKIKVRRKAFKLLRARGRKRRAVRVGVGISRPDGFSSASAIALGAMSKPKAAKPAAAKAWTSWPVPQPGTPTFPRFKSGCTTRKSTRPGDGADRKST